MKIIKTLRGAKFTKPSIMAIGSFDGIHLGHLHIFDFVLLLAKANNYSTFVTFFEPQPKEFFTNDARKLYRISSFRDKVRTFKKIGFDNSLVLHFNYDIAGIEPKEFIKILVYRFCVKHIVVGEDFRFGKNQAGDVYLLKRLAEKSNFKVDIVPTLKKDALKISSSRIRDLILKNNIQEAKKCLGREIEVSGIVMHGRENGRTIGFPTANLKLPTNSILKGVYFTKITIDDEIYYGISNAGVRPTVCGEKKLLEAYILNFDKQIYCKHIIVEILEFIRDEMKFESLENLKYQIKKDELKAYELLEKIQLS